MRSDALWLLVGRFAQLGNGFLLSIVLVRQFGLASAGTYTIASLAVMAASLVCTLGQIHSLPRSGLSVRQSSFVSLVSTLLAAPPALIAIAALGFLMAHSPDEFWEIVVFGVSGIFMAQMSIASMLLIMRGSAFLTVVGPLLGTLGIVAGGLLATSPLEFAYYVTASRLAANIVVYAVMGIEFVGFRRILAEMRRGFGYLATDAVLTANDQIATILLAMILTREDMGVWGICRQLTIAADTPSWSIVQAKYPEMIRSPHEVSASLAKQILVLSVAVAVTGTIASFGLGRFIYHVDILGPVMAILLLSLPARYLQNLDDQLMRAIGAGGLCAQIAAIRLPISVLFTSLAAFVWGIWGAAASVTATALVLVVVYRIVARSRLAEIPVASFAKADRRNAPA
jgi:O-antigen/teichoic acid export membrane protein